MRSLSLLLTTAIIAVLLYLWIRSFGGSDNTRGVAWWYNHPAERATQLKWCNEHPQSQDTPDCTLAVAAQMQADADAQSKK